MKTFCRLPGLLRTSTLIAFTRPQDTHQYRLKSDGRISCILLRSAKIVFSLADNNKKLAFFLFLLSFNFFLVGIQRATVLQVRASNNSLLLAGCQF